MIRAFGRGAVSDFLEDRIVYRNLDPADMRLPRFADLCKAAGLPPGRIPRKSEAGYARVVVQLLHAARHVDAPKTKLERLVFIGDTRMNDGMAFTNLCREGDWPGLAFIGSETDEPAAVEVALLGNGLALFLSNRWSALGDGAQTNFVQFCAAQSFPVDEKTVVMVDLDKTTIGARGRNAHTIDHARVDAVRQTVAALLGPLFDADAFRAAYDQINQPEFHPFTTDNQDYVAYICLLVGSGLFPRDALVADFRNKRFESFEQFMALVEARSGELPVELAGIHNEIYALVQAGDPTPFKAFRRNEYLATVGRMGHMDDDQPVERILAEEIVLTQEVRSLLLDWKQRGALLFGLSDKPDEASLPTPELAARGYRPIHRTLTHAVGEAAS